MSRYAERIAPVPVKTGARSAARQPMRPVPAQRTPLAHVLQLRAAQSARAGAAPAAADRGGLPAGLRSGIERLSGIAMDDVRVHRNSSEPAKLGALAYAKGSDIHLGPGQDRHLPHEAWHVVQQKQGKVSPTLQMKGGVAINDERALEREADSMGARSVAAGAAADADRAGDLAQAIASPVAQRAVVQLLHGAGAQPGQSVVLAANSLNDAAKASALEINRLARTGAQVEKSSVIGANNADNYHVRANYPGGRLETWVELTALGGGYVKRVRTESPVGTVTMDRVMDEAPGTALQQALVTDRVGAGNPLTGASRMGAMHGLDVGDAGGLNTAADSDRSADNFSKMVGEGARFAWLAARLANREIGNTSTGIFNVKVKIPQAGEFTMNPTFQQLWGAWDSAFGRSYMANKSAATQTLSTRMRARLRPARDNDADGMAPLASGHAAAGQVTSLLAAAGAGHPILMDNGGGLAIVTDLGMTWTADY